MPQYAEKLYFSKPRIFSSVKLVEEKKLHCVESKEIPMQWETS